jgi:hypothetical protein
VADLADRIADRVSRKYAAGEDMPEVDPARAQLLECAADAVKAARAGDEGGFLDAMLRLMDERDGVGTYAPPAEEAEAFDPDLE